LINTSDSTLKTAIGKLRLTSAFGTLGSSVARVRIRCGFLGLLHEIIQERLRREYNMDIIARVERRLRVETTRGRTLLIDNPAHLPDPSLIRNSGAGVKAVLCLAGVDVIAHSGKHGQMDHPRRSFGVCTANCR
jgi:translation elongation factor EF-4